MNYIKKRNGDLVPFDSNKIKNAIFKAFFSCQKKISDEELDAVVNKINVYDGKEVEKIQDDIEDYLIYSGYPNVAKSFIRYRERKRLLRAEVQKNLDFIKKYKESDNTANATIDDNANVSNKNMAVLNAEIHKPANKETNLRLLREKIHELYPDFDYKQMDTDFNTIMHLHDASSQIGLPYCASISLYPFILNGIKEIGGLSSAPKNIDSFCGMFVNMLFAVTAFLKGACATPGLFQTMDWYLRKRYGDDYINHLDDNVLSGSIEKRSLESQIDQWFQQITYSINQPSSARGAQSVFHNCSIFDKYFFEGMYGDFYYPDGTKPIWETFNWLQKHYLHWLNQERLRCMLTFPVVSVALIYKDGEFKDKEMADFVAQEYAEGNSFFTYISDTSDSLSSCCFSADTKVLWKSSTLGVQLTTFKELYDMKWEPFKKNFRIYHNGSWVKALPIKLPGRQMYKITTYNNKEICLTDNHINVTLNGEKPTELLTTDDYLMFSTIATHSITEFDEGLTFAQGFAVGAFLGDGSFGGVNPNTGKIYSIIYSQNAEKYQQCMEMVDEANEQVGGENTCRLATVKNNVYPVILSSYQLVSFIQRWTNWKTGTRASNKELNLDCLMQSYEFRRGILAGWYNTDGGNSNRCYTTSPKLAECMEALITSLGMQSIINISDRTDEDVIIRGEVYNRNYPLYCVRWYEMANHRNNKTKDKSWVKVNNSIYFKIKSIEKIDYSEDVYCVECKNPIEPYFTLPCGLITHNCRLSSKVVDNTFSFTNGQIGEQTGSLNVITLDLNRIVQDWWPEYAQNYSQDRCQPDKRLNTEEGKNSLKEYIITILDRVYKYQIAYKQILISLKEAGLLPIYDAGFINMDRQYLTIGVNGVSAAAEWLGIKCTNNEEYADFCHLIFGTIKEQNTLHKTKDTMFNTEFTPCESAAIKLYERDKHSSYWVPADVNLYTSYVFKPNDSSVSVLDKFTMHGDKFLGEYCDGGQAAHINLDSHLSKEQYSKLLEHAGRVGCKYFTFNIPNCECEDCGFIAKHPFEVCPKCGSKNVSLWDRIIGYLTKIKNWSKGRQIEQKTRVYSNLKQ